MVVFTCNNCGDSVNKPKVDKHIQYECKRKNFAVSFCCVDCLKDFDHETVRAHCQCVTEEQRYSAKGFVPKPSSEKGKRKQAGWVDVVQSIIDRKDLQNEERQLLSIIATFDNIPRKKNKFQNFCYSTAPAFRKKEHIVDKVFDKIEAEYKAEHTQNSNEKSADTNNVQNKNSIENVEKNDSVTIEPQEAEKKKKSVENCSDEETPQKKKKKKKKTQDIVTNEVETKSEENIEPQSEKKKKDRDTVNNEIETKSEENVEPQSEKKKKDRDTVNNEIETKSEENIEPQSEKKKKKKGKKQDNTVVTDGNVEIKNTSIAEIQSDLTKNSKQNKNKSKVEESNGINENGIINGENGVNKSAESLMSKKEKKEMKKKKKYQEELATVVTGVIETEKEPPLKKKKKRMLNDENDEPQQKILKIEEIPPVPAQSERKFEWNAAINQVLQSKKSKPMPISKVMKRVLNEYQFLNETTKKTENDLQKIFLKKLKKMKNVVVDNDKAQLVEC